MHKKKIAAVTMAVIISNFSANTTSVLAHELKNSQLVQSVSNQENQSSKAQVSKFNLRNSIYLEEYNKSFKLDNSKIISITNNGGKYNSSVISRAIDGDLSTHWETGTVNSSDFENEVILTLDEITTLNRIVYGARQDSAKGKGFAEEFEIYASLTDDGDDFNLISYGEYKESTRDFVEIKFNPTEFKRIKFKFKKANQNWASASEFMLYKEDEISEKMSTLFTDESMNTINEEFNTIDKLNALEEEAKSHPLYENFKEDIENAKTILNSNKIESTKAVVSKLIGYGTSKETEYDDKYMMPNSNISKIEANGGTYPTTKLEYMLDNKPETHWETNKSNSSEFTNELIFTLDEAEVLDRVAFLARENRKGFPEQFEIYASETSKGDTFQLVSSGEATVTNDFLQFKFEPTKFKRIKFKFKKCAIQDRPFVAEMRFYKQDELSDKMDRLFTDSSMNTVSEEFDSLDKIQAFEDELKSHPLYENFKEDLENAKILISQNKIESSKAVTQSFDYYDNEEYSKLFRVPLSNIKSIRNNAGYYASQVITNAVDGKLDTYWETNKSNNDTFNNEVEIEFEKTVTLNRVVYGARKSDRKGFAEQFEIYGSRTSKGDTYELVATGTHNKTTGQVEAKFNPTEFKRLKFKFVKSDQNWATLNEISFYTEDKIADKVSTLFTDGTMSEVREEFNSIEKINAFEEEAKNHPLYNDFKEDIDLAKDLVSNPQNESVMELEMRGDSVAKSIQKKVWRFQDWQATGYRAKPGDQIIVYVDVEDGEPTPVLRYKQILNQHGGSTEFSLKKGKNIITIPEYNVEADGIPEGTALGGGLYFTNYSSDKQSRAPKVRIVGAQKYALYKLGETDDETIMKELEEYVELVNANPEVVPDMFDISSDKTLCFVKATTALQWYKDNNKTPRYTAERWDETIKLAMDFWGFDNSSDLHSDYNFRIMPMTKDLRGGAFMNAGNGVIGIRPANQDAILNANRGWGVIHELGHNLDTSGRTIVEVTNNILPLYFESLVGNNTRITQQNIWESNTYPKVGLDDYSNNELYNTEDSTHLAQLAPLWQLQIYDSTFYPKFEKVYRENDFGNKNREDIYRSWVKAASEALELDLTEFFERHGIRVNDEVKEELSKYPKPDKKIEFLNDSALHYEGSGFSDDAEVNITKSINGENLNLSFEIDQANEDNLLGYEIRKDGKYIGFTGKSTFTDTDINLDENHVYTIIVYDKKLNTLESIELNSLAPSIISNPVITLGLNEEFDEKAFVTAKDAKGNDITDAIKVKSNNVDVTKRGEYEVVYSVVDSNGTEVTSKIKVNVVSKFDYLSDLTSKSATTGWGTMRKDKSINNGVIGLTRSGEIVTYSKGVGVHANSEVVYDLTDKGYDYFEAYVGVDQAMKDSPNSSIIFKVLVDGEEKYNSKLMKSSDNQKYVKVNVKGANELKLVVTDGGNGNTADHASWADAKLTTNNAKPVITSENKTYKLGEEIDFMAGIKASDAEDGDITSEVELESSNFEENKIGRFEATYKVTDSDNNTTKKKVYIIVSEDYTVKKSKFGSFDNLEKYNEEFKLPVVGISNNAGSYPGTTITNAIDGKINTHWETNTQNSSSFTNEVIFDLGEVKEISKMAYASRRDAGGKGFAHEFEIYASEEVEGDDFYLVGEGTYRDRTTDVVEFNMSNVNARRIKFKFVEANQGWASLSEVSFYKEDKLSNKIENDLFTDSSKSEVSETYNTFDKLETLREEIKNHPAYSLLNEEIIKAEEILRAKLPVIIASELEVVKLNSEFDFMSGVIASDQEDGDITENVKVDKGNFNIGKSGEYIITYEVTDSDGNTTTKERKVLVYSKEQYLSDMDWKSAISGWKDVNKDSAVSSINKIKLNVDGHIKEFDKGIGAATNAEIVYNLDGDYSLFTTYLGTDKNYDHNSTSIIFKIFADGKEVYTSDLIRKDSKAEFVSLDVTGVKELKLIADDAGNGGLGDFASWADTKVYTINSKPELTIPKSVSTKIREEIDLNEEYSASDAEDGDITSDVKITGEVNFNKAGKYPITYTVTDSDGNTVSKTRTVAVVNMDDYEYLTEYDWKSTQNSYKTPNIDKSISENVLRLTDKNNQEISYERGIGAHSTSTIIYDLSDKDYAYFTSYVGVDRAMFGTVGSVVFQVYVDGEKKFDSGLMNSRDLQKYVEVDINEAKELKLVVTDGGNGQGSDHATWADTKLHFANEEVNIKDKYLKSSIKKELNLTSDAITVVDMQKLTKLTVQGAESLEGLQYAKNLESLNIEYNEISDLSPLKNLKKLTDLKANPQIISAGEIVKKDNKVRIDYDVLNRNGEKLSPTDIVVRNNKTLEDTTLNVEDCLDEKGIISFDTTNFDAYVHSVYLKYEDINDDYLAQVLFMFNNR